MHIIGPQLGLTQPGMTIVCGDSHTSTHGAFGALAMGIGTSEVEHVLATQTLPLRPFKTMAINVDGRLPAGVSAKDIILAVIAKIGTGGGQGHVIEYRGSAIEALSMEGRMTICNMSIEAGARAGMVAPDETTYRISARSSARADGCGLGCGGRGMATGCVRMRVPSSTPRYTSTLRRSARSSPGAPIRDRVFRCLRSVPDPELMFDDAERQSAEKALTYMDLQPGTAMRDIPVDVVFVGSCTNGRIEDLRVVADVLRGRKVADGVRMLVVPGSMRVRAQAESEGLGEIFTAAGAEWRQAGCSMCLGMNPDQLSPGQRCASTSNRNFEGRQGKGGRTHLVSPAVAAATAVRGTLSSPADLSR